MTFRRLRHMSRRTIGQTTQTIRPDHEHMSTVCTILVCTILCTILCINGRNVVCEHDAYRHLQGYMPARTRASVNCKSFEIFMFNIYIYVLHHWRHYCPCAAESAPSTKVTFHISCCQDEVSPTMRVYLFCWCFMNSRRNCSTLIHSKVAWCVRIR
jgi:hypothetical protein